MPKSQVKCPYCGRLLRQLHARRTRAGMNAAKDRGVHIGREASLTAEQVRRARKLLKQGNRPDIVAAWYGIHRSTLYRNLAKHARAESRH